MFTAPNPFRLIAARATRVLDRLEEKLLNGEVTTRSALLVSLIDGIARFTRSLAQPALQAPQMQLDDLLLRDLVETPVADAAEDLQLASDQVETLRDLTLQVTNLCLAEHAGLKSQLAELTAQADAFRLWVSDSSADFLWVGDTFNDRSRMDPASTVFLDPRAGTLSLTPTSARSLTQYITEAGLDKQLSAGGLPGNNLEIQEPGLTPFTGSRPEPRPVTYHDHSPKPDALSALWDGEPTSWFEWERYLVLSPQPVIHAGASLVYDPSGKPRGNLPALGGWNCYIRWPGESQVDTGAKHQGYPMAAFGNRHQIASWDAAKYGAWKPELTLAIHLSLDQPRPVSWLQLTPLIRAGAYPEVVQILVSADGERWRSLLTERTVLHPRMNRGVDFSSYGITASNFEGVGVWPMPAAPIQHLKIVLRQKDWYECPLGIAHYFTAKVRKKHKKTVYSRAKGHLLQVGSFASLPGEKEQDDYQDTELQSARRKVEAFDSFRAWRQAIAIKDLLIEERVYAADGQYLSAPFKLARAGKAVALLATERIPEDWPEADPEGNPWIEYEVSADGHTWQPILPQRTELEESVVEFAQPTTTLYFRANLTRPEASDTESPVLLAYGLKVLPA